MATQGKGCGCHGASTENGTLRPKRRNWLLPASSPLALTRASRMLRAGQLPKGLVQGAPISGRLGSYSCQQSLSCWRRTFRTCSACHPTAGAARGESKGLRRHQNHAVCCECVSLDALCVLSSGTGLGSPAPLICKERHWEDDWFPQQQA